MMLAPQSAIISPAIARRIRIMGSLKDSLNSAQNVVGSVSGITLEPCVWRDAKTAWEVKPVLFIVFVSI
jgi:hypothetical protein